MDEQQWDVYLKNEAAKLELLNKILETLKEIQFKDVERFPHCPDIIFPG